MVQAGLFLLVAAAAQGSTPVEDAARGVVARVIPAHAAEIDVAQIPPAPGGADVFEVETVAGRLKLRGNSAVSISSGLGWYLAHVAHLQLSWVGENLSLPEALPAVPHAVRIASPFRCRAYLNYCTFNYTMSWWDRARWEREIDWMALHGVTMPLATTGLEAVWQATLRRFGMNDEQIRTYLVGPAYTAWQNLTNIEQWAGPLPQSWIDSHLELGKFILARERELGMTPILQGFTGCVPLALRQLHPSARIAAKVIWCAVPPGTAQLDPDDPLFGQMGRAFLEEQTRLLGTDHLYAADPFHESEPPSSAPGYLEAVGAKLFSIASGFDPRATIVMQGWTIREGVVRGIPEDRLLVLDLTGDKWKETQAFWGRPWVLGILHNFGGRTFLGGNLPEAASRAPSLLKSPSAGKLVGIGAFPEAIDQNPIVYDLAFDLAWTRESPDLHAWVHDYAWARYGRDNPDAQAAWSALLGSVYSQRDTMPSMETPIQARPALALDRGSPWGNFERGYDPAALWTAWTLLESAAGQLGAVDPFRYDLVDVARQALADLSLPLHAEVSAAYRAGDKARLAAAESRFLGLIADMDQLVATRREFLLGRWVSQARAWGSTAQERDLYERNARMLVTVWGPNSPGAFLADYAERQWSGLLGGFYLRRWEQFFAFLATQPPAYSEAGLPVVMNRPGNEANRFYHDLAQWEYAWCDGHERSPSEPVGDPVQVSRRLLQKWRPAMEQLYPSYPWKKPNPGP